MQALLFILNTLLTLIVVAYLLRVLMPMVRADFRNPIGQAVLTLTNPLVLPLRRILPASKKSRSASAGLYSKLGPSDSGALSKTSHHGISPRFCALPP